MNCSRCAEQLDAYADGELNAADRAEVETHLATCESCRREASALASLRTTTSSLPRALRPSRDLWPDLAVRMSPPKRAKSVLRWLTLPLAAALAALGVFLARGARSEAWNVMPLAGNPRVAERVMAGDAALRRGDWVETDGASRVRIAVGAIGEVRLAPNSRLRLVTARKSSHRVELTRGTLEALIWSPPRLFFVDTPAAEVIDLGCAYRLTVDDRGDGELVVTAGYVALEHHGLQTIVPGGFKCEMRRHGGPGTPFDPAADPALRQALETFDRGEPALRSPALRTVLATARVQDAVTLWHLLASTGPTDRGAVFERLAQFAPPPASVTRDGIVAGADSMRRAWGISLGLAL